MYENVKNFKDPKIFENIHTVGLKSKRTCLDTTIDY